MANQDTTHDDVLTELTTNSISYFKIILTYISQMATEKKKKSKTIKDNLTELPTILLRGFSAHLGFIGEQRLDRTGKLNLDAMENFNLLRNGDNKYEGQITCSRNQQKNATDFAFVNQQLYNII